MKFLVDKGASVNSQTSDETTLVFCAAANGKHQVFYKLLELGGDPSNFYYYGGVPLGLMAARDMKKLPAFAEFIAMNPKIKERMDMGISIVEQGQTELHIAANEGTGAAVQALLNAGADAHKCNEFGNSPSIMLSRAENITSDERLACMKSLVDSGADVKVYGEEGKQAIHFVTFLGEPEYSELLLKQSADLPAVTNAKTPLHLCALENLPEIAEILLKFGAKLNELDSISVCIAQAFD